MMSLPKKISPQAKLVWPTQRCGLNLYPVHRTNSNDQLMQQIAKVSQEVSGWILFLAPPSPPTVAEVERYGINPERVIVLNALQIKSWSSTVETTLNNGRFCAVIAWPPSDLTLDLNTLPQQSKTLLRLCNQSQWQLHAPR